LAQDGVLPPSVGRGGYDLDECRTTYIRYLRGRATGQVKEKEHDDNYSRLLEKEKYREKKRQNDLEEGKVAPVELLTAALEKVADQIIPILESLPLLIKRHYPEITGDQITMVKRAISESRNIISDIQIDID